MANERINILIGSDINYAPYYGVMLTSLFMNNKESQFDIYLLTDSSWTDQETQKFETLCRQYNSNFYVYVVNVNLVKDFPKAAHITLPTYYRLQSCNILPKSVHKILYLDGDMIVVGDIRPLWGINLDGYAFAGAEDMDSVFGECYTRLGYDPKYGYSNAGVSLYNLDYWRKYNISEQLMQLIANSPEIIKWMDQDAMNALLHGKRYRLPQRYNFQTLFLSSHWWRAYSDEQRNDIKSECRNVVIVHYNGVDKPWYYQYFGLPFWKEWRYYNKRSAWMIEIKAPVSFYLKWSIKRVKRCIKKMLRIS